MFHDRVIALDAAPRGTRRNTHRSVPTLQHGYSPLPGDPSHCQDVDECQIAGMCQQMCVNYEGGFECYCEVGYELLSDHSGCRKIGEGEKPPTATPVEPWATRRPGPVWDPQEPAYYWTPQQSQTDWPPEEDDSLNWLTDPPVVDRRAHV